MSLTADTGLDLPPEVAQVIAERTRGWNDDKKLELARELRRKSAKTSAGNLAMALDPNTVQTDALRIIDRELAAVDAGDVDRLIITVPPQEGKSTRVARYGTLWALLQNPDRRCAIASYASELAVGHGRFIRDLIDGFGRDAPGKGGVDLLGLKVKPSSRAAGRWDLADVDGGLYCVGIMGGLTGKPVSWLTIDDPFKDRADANSLPKRNAVWNWWTDVVIPRLAPGAPVILIMTRWHEDDLVGRLIEEDKALPPDQRRWRVINIPAECEDEQVDPLGRKLGEFLTSARDRTVEQWRAIKRSVGARTWASLYQGHPTPSEGGVFKWDWIRPHRLREPPDLRRVAVAVDTTGGGRDEAGIIGGGRDAAGRTYVTADRSGSYTAGGQWRQAWFTVLDLEADVLVYEKNLVDPIMRKAIPASWKRMREQARALADANLLDVDPDDVDETILEGRLRVAANALSGHGDDDIASADDPQTALVGQLAGLLGGADPTIGRASYAVRILASPELGPARVEGVAATRGKLVRAEPASQAYETGQVSHVGYFPALEGEMVTWQEGQDSPNRLDALVWLWTYLAVGSAPGKVATGSPAGPRVPTGAGAVTRPRR